MKIECSLCDLVEEVDPNSQLAKKYQNHPLKTYLCPSCYERIAEKAQNRLAKRNELLEKGPITPLP